MRRLWSIVVNRTRFELVSVCRLLDIERKKMFLLDLEEKS